MTLSKLVVVVAVAATSFGAQAQVAGTQPLSVTVEQSNALLSGWSVKKSILGKAVYNDQIADRTRTRRSVRSAIWWLLPMARCPQQSSPPADFWAWRRMT
jgi:hypothetical protein